MTTRPVSDDVQAHEARVREARVAVCDRLLNGPWGSDTLAMMGPVLTELEAAAYAHGQADERARCVPVVEGMRVPQPPGAGIDRGPSLYVLGVNQKFDDILSALRREG